MHKIFQQRRQQLRREREQRVADLIAYAARKTYKRLSQRCECGRDVCVCRDRDWPEDAA